MAIQFVKEVPFKNWTNTEFTYKYQNDDYTFEAGGTYNVPSDIALHFAKHLAIRELHASGKTSDEALPEQKMIEYQDKCFPVKLKQPGIANSFERIDVENGKSEEAIPVKENKTEKDAQMETSEDDEADASDDKNNAGAPLIKGLKAKSKDARYVK